MKINNFENIVYEIADEFNVEIVDDELFYNYNLLSCTFYIHQFFKNELIDDDDEINKYNKKIDELINNFVVKLHNELDNELNFNCYVVNDEIEIELNNDDVFEIDDVDELYDDMKIYF